MSPLDYVRENSNQCPPTRADEAPRDRPQNQDNIPERLNTPAQARANSHDQHTPSHTPTQPITPVGGAAVAREVIGGARPYLTGAAAQEAERLAVIGREELADAEF